MTPTAPTTVRHPYQAGRAPRRLYLGGTFTLVAATGVMAVGGVLMLALHESAVIVVILGVGLWALSGWLQRRAWFSVAWAHQDGAAEPAWVTNLSRGLLLVFVVGLLVSGLMIGRLWSAAWSVLASGAFAAWAIRRAISARRDGLAPRWRAWRIIDAVTVSMTAVGVVVYLGATAPASAPGNGLVAAVFVILAGAMTLAVGMVLGPARHRDAQREDRDR